MVRRAFWDFLYNKLLWLKSAKLPLRALQNSINRNVVPANGCSKCLHPWGITDGEFINVGSGRARGAEQGWTQGWCHRHDVIWEDPHSGPRGWPGYSLWRGKVSIRPYSWSLSKQFWGEEHWWNRNQWNSVFLQLLFRAEWGQKKPEHHWFLCITLVSDPSATCRKGSEGNLKWTTIKLWAIEESL